MNPHHKLILGIQTACLLVIAAWFLVPSLYATRDFRFLVVAATATWIVSEYANNPVDFLTFDWIKIALAAAIATCIFGAYITEGAPGIRSSISLAIALSLVFIGTQMMKRPHFEFYWGAIAIIGLFIFVALTSNEKLVEDKWAGRAVVRNSDRASELASENVGGYIFAYFTSALCPILVFLSLKLPFSSFKNSLLRIVATFGLLIGGLFLFRAGYGIAIISAAIGCLIVGLPGKLNTPIFWAVLLAAIVVFFMFREPIFEQSKSFTKGGPLYRKVLALEEMSSLEGTGDVDSKGRLERYTRSINSFLDSPLVGTLSPTGVGKHSTLLDVFAKFGLICGISLILALFLPLYHIYQIVEPANKKLVLASAICLFMHAGLNNLQAGSTLAVFILMPFAISVVQQFDQQTNTAPSQIDHEFIVGA